LPLALNAPVHPPDAAQAVAFVDVQVRVDADPAVITEGLAVNTAVGITLICTLATGLVPPGPVQVNENALLVATGPLLRLPDAASVPSQLPEAVQAVALFVELQASVEAAPAATIRGLALSVTVGAGVTVTVAVAAALVPPSPVQVSENDVVAVSAPVVWVPRVLREPVQPPAAVQAVAFVEVQVSVDAAPLATVVGFAARVTVGAGVPALPEATVTVAVAAVLVPFAAVHVIV